ncbi:hypothetical protein [Lutibacter sp.]|uniref:hypothetical protein n=1 Tax=Lutibacter sp. TaxID=1925666 RepID=UPI0025BF4A17|nr:hypothetical protein [Lutibacter sp.]MCF6180772.1 hypothetical protein [Lutibacter sp.]
MKNQLSIIRTSFLVLLSVFMVTMSFAQKVKKNKVRLSVSYTKIMDGELYFDIKATSKIKNKNTFIPNLDLTIYNVLNDEEIKIGKITTNMDGKGRLVLPKLDSIHADSTNTYTILVKFKGNASFKKAKKSINFKNANIKASIIKKDSINFIQATLIETSLNMPLSEATLNVQVQRLFKSLKIGKDFYTTDENGTILVSIPTDIPGIDGILTFEVVLADSDNYGTVKAMVTAPLGTQIVQDNDFYKREMWSPRDKTPLFLLIFPNLLTFAVWGIIIYLILNLIKLSKLNN